MTVKIVGDMLGKQSHGLLPAATTNTQFNYRCCTDHPSLPSFLTNHQWLHLNPGFCYSTISEFETNRPFKIRMSVSSKQPARSRRGPNTSPSRLIRALLPRSLWLLLLSAGPSICFYISQDQAIAANALTTVPDYVIRHGTQPISLGEGRQSNHDPKLTLTSTTRLATFGGPV